MNELDQYRNSVFRFALNLTNDWNKAEDLTQECLLRALKHSQQLNEKKAVLSWLFKILRNIWIDAVRKKRISIIEFDDQHLSEVFWQKKCNQTNITETIEEVLRQMQSLPQRQREVLFLHAVEDFSIDEIATSLDLNRSAVKANLSLARKSMRKLAQSQPET